MKDRTLSDHTTNICVAGIRTQYNTKGNSVKTCHNLEYTEILIQYKEMIELSRNTKSIEYQRQRYIKTTGQPVNSLTRKLHLHKYDFYK